MFNAHVRREVRMMLQAVACSSCGTVLTYTAAPSAQGSGSRAIETACCLCGKLVRFLASVSINPSSVRILGFERRANKKTLSA
jgi:hypothetical protein